MRETVLAVLRAAQGGYVSGEELSKRLRVSRTAVWKYIGALREDGYEIESSPRLGYRLVRVPDLLSPLEIREGLNTKIMGCNIHHFREVDSTNRLARELAEAGEPEGAVVLADRQTAGRGRLGRSWCSPEGGIWLSVILRPSIAPYKVQLVTLLAAVAAVEAARDAAGLVPGIKWPNDLLVGGKKLAGILTEVSAEMERVNHLVVGIGLNANVPAVCFSGELEDVATSILAETGQAFRRSDWVKAFLEHLEREYLFAQADGFHAVLGRWRKYSVTLGCDVNVALAERNVRGRAVDINEQGALVVETPEGRETFWAGEVSLREKRDN